MTYNVFGGTLNPAQSNPMQRPRHRGRCRPATPLALPMTLRLSASRISWALAEISGISLLIRAKWSSTTA